MAAKQTTVGIDHPTVVPTNFEREDDDAETVTDADVERPADGDGTDDVEAEAGT